LFEFFGIFGLTIIVVKGREVVNKCRTALETYRRTREHSDWFFFYSATRQAKQCFFDNRIAEIASTNKQPWNLMSWVKQRKLLAVEAICFQGQPCNDLPDLWSALHQSYNAVADRSIDFSVLDKVSSQATRSWVPFSMLEMQEALKACSNVSAFLFCSSIYYTVLDCSLWQTIYNK